MAVQTVNTRARGGVLGSHKNISLHPKWVEIRERVQRLQTRLGRRKTSIWLPSVNTALEGSRGKI